MMTIQWSMAMNVVRIRPSVGPLSSSVQNLSTLNTKITAIKTKNSPSQLVDTIGPAFVLKGPTEKGNLSKIITRTKISQFVKFCLSVVGRLGSNPNQ